MGVLSGISVLLSDINNSTILASAVHFPPQQEHNAKQGSWRCESVGQVVASRLTVTRRTTGVKTRLEEDKDMGYEIK